MAVATTITKCGRCNGTGYRWSMEYICWHCGGTGNLKKETEATKDLMYTISVMIEAQPLTRQKLHHMYRLEHTATAIKEAIDTLFRFKYIEETGKTLTITAFGKDRVEQEMKKRMEEIGTDWLC